MRLGTGSPVHPAVQPSDHPTGHATLGGALSRRRFLAGSAGTAVLLTVGAALVEGALAEPWAYADGPTQGLPTRATAPEQVHLTWGGDPSTEVTVSWASPGTAAMSAAALQLDTRPIGRRSPAKVVAHAPYTDGMNLETVHSYHAELSDLAPATTYHYRISDGAVPPSTVDGTFTTAPAGRAAFSFTSVGDLSTPTAAHNVSGSTWPLSCDNAYFLPLAVEAQAPLFHLLNGDLCYANLATNNQPEVWRDFGRNNQASAAARPWMPCLGNHEIEFGADDADGSVATNGGWNGAHGYASYQSRYRLPDNGVPGLRGYFYAFQIGTVLFVSLDADDVAYQDGGSYYAPKAQTDGTYLPLTATNPAISIPPGASRYNRTYTGQLAAGPDHSLVPDPASGTPNEQTLWLERTLAAARENASVDMIVVQIHQCALSSSATGNGCDLGIRQTWLPLFDAYSVDLVVNGHDHDYERSFAVRGYDTGYRGTVVAPNPGQRTGHVQTRRPSVAESAGPLLTATGETAFDTSVGTVFLTLGGGGTDGPTDGYAVTPKGRPEAKVITRRNEIYVSGSAYVKNQADSVEEAPWSARRDAVDAYGFALFAVDPGSGSGKTTITMTYFHAPEVTGGAVRFQGTTSYSVLEKVVFGRGLAAS